MDKSWSGSRTEIRGIWKEEGSGVWSIKFSHTLVLCMSWSHSKYKPAHTSYIHSSLQAKLATVLQRVSKQCNSTSWCALQSRWCSWVPWMLCWRLQVLEAIFATDLRPYKMKCHIPVTAFLYPGVNLVLRPFQNGVSIKLTWRRESLYFCVSLRMRGTVLTCSSSKLKSMFFETR